MKYIPVLTLACALLFGTAQAQIASGNVAESSHPRADAIDAQNPHIHRTVQGCITAQGAEYFLVAKHLGTIHLSSKDLDLSQHTGQRVKVVGDLEPVSSAHADDDNYNAPAAPREMMVEKLDQAPGVCPAK